MAVPLAWPRRQPDFCRERNRRRSCLASPGSGLRRLHSRQKPGRASPARRGEQPTSAGTRALRSTPPRLVHRGVMLRTQQRQILHHSRPTLSVRVFVMRVQRPRRRPRTPRIRTMPIPKRECDPLSPTRQPRPRITVNFFPIQQHRLTVFGLQQMRTRRRNRSTRNQHTINRRSQLTGIKRSRVKNLSAKLCTALLRTRIQVHLGHPRHRLRTQLLRRTHIIRNRIGTIELTPPNPISNRQIQRSPHRRRTHRIKQHIEPTHPIPKLHHPRKRPRTLLSQKLLTTPRINRVLEHPHPTIRSTHTRIPRSLQRRSQLDALILPAADDRLHRSSQHPHRIRTNLTGRQ